MTQKQKINVSDRAVMILGFIGLVLGVSGLIFPQSQYEILGLNASSIGTVIPGLMGSAGLSATYMGLMYIFGIIQKWPYFKHYLIFARMVMALGFIVLILIGRAPDTYISAALWEVTGAGIIALTLWWDKRKTNKK